MLSMLLHQNPSSGVAAKAKTALLLLVLPLLLNAVCCDCRQEKYFKDNKQGGGCGTSPALWTLPRHALPLACSEMPPSLYSYSVQKARSADSLQSTEFLDTDSGLVGSFELEHSLSPPDSLLIVLGETADSAHTSEHGCWRLPVCNQTADGLRRRLRLRVSLRPSRSYTMKVFKLANGSRLCEQPRVRFFFTRSAAGDLPLLQLAVRRCGTCDDDASGDFRCDMEAYLRTGWLNRVRLRVTGVLGERSDRIYFIGNASEEVSGCVISKVFGAWSISLVQWHAEFQAQLSWMKANFSMQIQSKQLTLHFFNGREIITARRNIFALSREDISLQRPTLCQPSEPLAACPMPLTLPAVGKLRSPTLSTFTKSTTTGNTSAILLRTLPAALVLAICLALYRALNFRRCSCNADCRRLVVLALPEERSRPGAALVRRLCRQLDADSGRRFNFRQIVGLRSLTRQLVGSSRLIILVSWDSEFASFGLGDLSDEASSRNLRTMLLAEKHRMRGFFIDSGAAPAADSVWAGLDARMLGLDEASLKDAARSLLDLLGECSIGKFATR